MMSGQIQSLAQMKLALEHIKRLRRSQNAIKRDGDVTPEFKRRLLAEVQSKIALQQARVDEYLCRTQGCA